MRRSGRSSLPPRRSVPAAATQPPYACIAGGAKGLRPGRGPTLRPCWRHDGYVPEVDDDQLAALRRLRAAFGFVEVVEVIGHNPDDDLAATPDESMQEARIADPRRMTPEERRQAHPLLTRALSDPTGEPPARLSMT